MIHGPGNKGNLNLLYNVVKKGIPWPLGDFDNRRSFTSIDNLCYVIEGLLNQDVLTGIYHMGDDEALSTNELIGQVEWQVYEISPYVRNSSTQSNKPAKSLTSGWLRPVPPPRWK